MPDALSFHRVSWRTEADEGLTLVEFVGLDTYTQQTYRFRVPIHMLPALADHLARTLERHAGALVDVTTQRIDG